MFLNEFRLTLKDFSCQGSDNGSNNFSPNALFSVDNETSLTEFNVQIIQDRAQGKQSDHKHGYLIAMYSTLNA